MSVATRLIIESELPPELPMSRDREDYSRFDPELDSPLLRFYRWQRPALTIGRFQSLEPEREAQLTALDLPVLRRPTGGAAILHNGDLTFSLTGPAELLPGSLLEGHARITRALALGLQRLGISALTGSAGSQARPLNCFDASTPADLRVVTAPAPAGAKLIGTAQVRRRKAFLLQGMIYLRVDAELMRSVFGAGAPIADLTQLLDTDPDPDKVANALAAGFADELGLDLRL